VSGSGSAEKTGGVSWKEVAFRRISTDEDLRTVERLSAEIWNEHYTPLIGRAQVEYMLTRFLALDALHRQLAEGYEYYLVEEARRPIGYFAFQLRGGTELFLSKYYLEKSRRGKGYGRRAMDLLAETARRHGARTISLTVNKGNALALEVYRRLGFRNAGSLVTDIGGGFVMDDYRLERPV